ncbi:MAG TPA: vanadium-dependent haloperoxidase [Thermoanaerobaculia bacterium]|nr:vanadium-dependent haloperoxidase [Thermoanaerobaculia bacterium]
MNRELGTRAAGLALAVHLVAASASPASPPSPVAGDGSRFADKSVARQWNEELLDAIRRDFARPTVHARNLFHLAAAMYDGWAVYDTTADTYMVHERAVAGDVAAARRETISYAAYRLLLWRFASSPGVEVSHAAFDARMAALGYDPTFLSTEGSSPAALGNRIAQACIHGGLDDGANEQGAYSNLHYQPVNPTLVPHKRDSDPGLIDPNRWQPLTLDVFVDQNGIIIPGGSPPFLSPEWGRVVPFAMTEKERLVFVRDGAEYPVYHDPGPPPLLGSDREQEYLDGFQQVLEWSSLLDPNDGVLIDISPGARGNNTLGTNDGKGRDRNPVTGKPYEPQVVPAGDYYRVLAEFWADGPHSETPPGHWFTILNYVSDHPGFERRIGGEGPLLDELEWNVKAYLALGGAMHDAAIACWGIKGWYDYVRPISVIRHMASKGQRSDPSLPSYDPHGLRLVPGLVELITEETVAPGAHHEHLGFVHSNLGTSGNRNIGKIAVRAWRGHDPISDPKTQAAGVAWILAENWWPYQRPTFVTPPFAGYTSGHSTYSRAAAELMTRLTGSPFFPGGKSEFFAEKNEYLVFEDGPSVDVTLQWATYQDAADECSLSRIYGGIHPPQDDLPGRLIGARIGPAAFAHALRYFSGDVHGGKRPAEAIAAQAEPGGISRVAAGTE